MPDTFEDLSSVQFVTKLVNEKYSVRVPAFLDHHQWWNNWEKVRFESMEALLKPGMIFWDCGAFDGWQDAIISHFVGGGQNMVLIEPVEENWPNIRATWAANQVVTPHSTCITFIGTGKGRLPWVHRNNWPSGPDYSKLISVTKFKLLNEHAHNTSCISMDALSVGIGPPDAINVDVEGAELEVLRSAELILRKASPIVWVSIHPQFMRERFRTKPEEVLEFMEDCGYQKKWLGDDHEEHWSFIKK